MSPVTESRRPWLPIVALVLFGTTGISRAEVVTPPPHGARDLRAKAVYLHGYANEFRKAAAAKRRITDSAWLGRVRNTVDTACEMAKALDRWDDNLPPAAKSAYYRCAKSGPDAGKGCFAKIEADLSFGGVAAYPGFAQELDASGRNLEQIASCLRTAQDAQRQADLEVEAEQRAKEERRREEDAQRAMEEQARAREAAEEQRREEEERLREEEQRRREEEKRRRDEQARHQQPYPTESSGGPSGGSTSVSVSSSGNSSTAVRATRVIPRSSGVAAATTTALVGGTAMMALGATMNVEDGVTPFEINIGATAGLARSAFGVGGVLELRYLHWFEGGLRPGETVAKAARRMRGIEAYAVGRIGGLFDSWVNCPPRGACVSETEAGRLLYTELGARYWQRWYGAGLVVTYLDEGVTAKTAMLDGEPPKDYASTAVALELLASLGRAQRKMNLYGGIRIYGLTEAGFTLRMGMNRMLVGLDLVYSDMGFMFGPSMGLRFAL